MLYTRGGDEGFTKDYAGNRVIKDAVLIVANGKVDTLQSAIDMALHLDEGAHREILEAVQRKLWQISGEVAHCPGECLNDPVTPKDLTDLEQYIDALGEPPKAFVRFRTPKSIWFNECRVRCRELETHLVKLLREGTLRPEVYRYINRLSSLFFMLGYFEGRN
jgi:cob(I)alamin adenosyltransferase